MVKGLKHTQYLPQQKAVLQGYVYYCCASEHFVFDCMCRKCNFNGLTMPKGKYNHCEDAVEVEYQEKENMFITKEPILETKK